MVKDHIKRINAPRRWNILRKNYTFISRPNTGRDFTLCISLNTALKEMLGKTNTTKESKYLIKNKEVLINGKPIFDEKFPVGFLDVMSFPALNEHYRLLVSDENKLFLLKIKEEESKLKLSKVMNKKTLPKNIIQINSSDGRNFQFSAGDKALNDLKINDTILYSLPKQEIKQIIKLEKGVLVYLYKGKHIGKVVSVSDFKGENIIFALDKEVFETKKAYAFAIGKDAPIITLSEKTNREKQEKHESKEHKQDKKTPA